MVERRIKTRGARSRVVLALPFAALLGAAAHTQRALPGELAGGERAWATQLHIHGPFSEGTGSIESHSIENRDKVDVLWWSDHDFRIASYRCASRFGFEDVTSPLAEGEPWTARWMREEREKKRVVAERIQKARQRVSKITADDAFEGEHSMRIGATSPTSKFRSHMWRFETDRNLQRRPLAAQVTLQIAILGEEIGPDAHAVVEVELSEHTVGKRLRNLTLRFVVGGEGEPGRDGSTYSVPLPARPGEWQVYELPITETARLGFPEIAAEDNSLYQIFFGVEMRKHARASALFDDLRILQEHRGPEMFAVQRDVLAEVGETTPDLVQLQGSEISYVRTHINEFSVDTRLPDYEAFARTVEEEVGRLGGDLRKRFRHTVTKLAIEGIHARGGLASYNHMFGASSETARPDETREEVLQLLTGTRAYGADILEVGYRDRGGRPLADHLWVWDRLGERGIFLVGDGVSDAHAASPRAPRTNDMISWIYAPAPTKSDLIEGLRRGRVFFGDPDLFDGAIDLVTAEGFRMGSIVVTDAAEAAIEIEVEGLRPGQLVRAVGPWDEPPEFRADGPSLHAEVVVPLSGPIDVVRVEIRDPSGVGAAFSNPITFVKDPDVAAPMVASGRVRP